MRFYVLIGTSLCIAMVGCNSGPVATGDLNEQEASIAAEGSAAMRNQDGTAGDPQLATLDGGFVRPSDPFSAAPFIERERINREADLDESDIAPGAETLEAGIESPTGDPMDQPSVNVQDE